jgi:hypothetical protein
MSTVVHVDGRIRVPQRKRAALLRRDEPVRFAPHVQARHLRNGGLVVVTPLHGRTSRNQQFLHNVRERGVVPGRHDDELQAWEPPVRVIVVVVDVAVGRSSPPLSVLVQDRHEVREARPLRESQDAAERGRRRRRRHLRVVHRARLLTMMIAGGFPRLAQRLQRYV